MIENQSKISPRLRDLILKVSDNNPEALRHIFHLLNHCVRSIDVMNWLVENKVTGQKFADFVYKEFDRSYLLVVKYILMKVDKDVRMRPLYIGKDYR